MVAFTQPEAYIVPTPPSVSRQQQAKQPYEALCSQTVARGEKRIRF